MLNRIKNVINNNLSDIISLFILTSVSLLFLFISRGYYGDAIIDCGREIYLPQAILEGKILFKDILGMYNPLSYQINAILYFIFGSSITTLKIAGIINATVILGLIYGITRFFLKPFYACSICLFIFLNNIFLQNQMINFVMPYAYSITYALTFFLFSVLFFIKYCLSKNIKYSYISYLFLGLSLACKPEYSLCIIAYLILQTIFKEDYKKIFLNIVVFFVPVIISYSVLFIQGLTISDLQEYIKFLVNLFNTDEQKYFNENFIALPLSVNNLLYIFCTFIYTLFVYYILTKLTKNYLRDKDLITLCIFILFAYFLTIEIAKYTLNTTAEIITSNKYSWIGLALIPACIYSIKKDKLLSFLAIIAILTSIRTNLIFLNYLSCQSFFIIFPIAVIFIYVFKYLIKDDKTKLSLSIVIITLGLLHSFGHWKNILQTPMNAINTNNKGLIYANKEKADAINDSIKWISENTNKDDSILILPEGILMNFITERKTNLKYYHLIPNHIQALGEDFIVENLLKEKPDYIIINTESYFNYNDNTYMCENFGLKICKFIDNNYENVFETNTSKDYKMKIYKELEKAN